MPADFSPSDYARSAFGIIGGKAETVELVFAAEIAGYVRERNWHESQALADEPDGGVRLTLEVAPSFDLKAWIKGFLPHVEVVRPAALRDEIARELEAAREAFPGRRAARMGRRHEAAMSQLETFTNPKPGPRLPDRAHLPRVHLGLPEDGPARLRDDADPLRAGPAVRRAQEPEALPAGATATRGSSSRR